MSLWDSQLVGIFIGSGIAGVFTLLGQRLSNQRQERQLAHDLEARERQFAHEKEQEVRGRRTDTLADLQVLLDEQATALEDLWGFLDNPDVRPHLRISPGDALKVLQGRSYRRHLWAIHLPSSLAINEYAEKTAELLSFLKQQDFADLYVGDIPALDEKLRDVATAKIQTVGERLAIAQKGIHNLMTLLNGIEIPGVG